MSDTDRQIELIDDLRAFADDLGHTPTREEMNEDGPHSSTPYYNEFGSWNAALEAAGLNVHHRNDVSDDALLDELQRLDEELDRPPLWEDMESKGRYSPHTYHRRWGSWLEAREAAGLDGSEIRHGQRVGREALIEALRNLAMDLGRPPSQLDMNDRGEYSPTPYYTEFGSWREALDAAGVRGERNVNPPRE